MPTIENQLYGDVYDRVEALRRDTEEALVNITEDNLKLSQPYVAGRSGEMELEVTESGDIVTLQVYCDGVLRGSIQLS